MACRFRLGRMAMNEQTLVRRQGAFSSPPYGTLKDYPLSYNYVA
jgi:hypothetical protein